MNGNGYDGVRVEGAKCGVGSGSALAISDGSEHSILWAINGGMLGRLRAIQIALSRR